MRDVKQRENGENAGKAGYAGDAGQLCTDRADMPERAAAWGWFLFCFVFLLLFLNRHMVHLLDSDLSSELILANAMAKDGYAVFHPGWIYSSELRVLNTQLVFSNLFRLTDNWHLVRILSNAVLYGILLCSFCFFCRQAGLKRAFPLLAGCLLLPTSVEYFDFVLKGVYYIPHISISFLVLGLLLRIVQKKDKRWRAVDAVLLAALSLTAGLGGLRQLFVLYVPLLLAAALLLEEPAKRLLAAPGKESLNLLREEGKANPSVLFFAASAAAAGFACAGYLINKGVLSRFFTFESYAEIRWTGLSLERLEQVLSGWLSSFGYRSGKALFSEAAAGNLISALFVVLLCRTLWKLVRRRKEEKFEDVAIGLFLLLAALVFTVFYCVTDMEYHDRYNLPIAVFALPVIAGGLQRARVGSSWKKVLGVLLCLLCLLTAVGNYRFFAQTMRIRADEKKRVADFLTDNGYYNGYASFWNANVLTEMSNGQIEVWTADQPENLGDLRAWLQKADHFERVPEGKVFLLAEDYELQEGSLYSRLPKEKLIYQTEALYVYGYESYEAIPAEMKTAAQTSGGSR